MQIMSGHSKWSQIKHKKAAADERRGQLFSKLSRLIAVAAREGGTDPSGNTKLREAIEKAKSLNMPSENIARAMRRGTGEGETKLEEFLYEAYGPGGVAMLVLGITDNTNRSLGEIKHILNSHHGKLASPGSVLWAFDHVRGIWAPKKHLLVDLGPKDKDYFMQLLDALNNHDDVQNVFTNEKKT